MRVLTLLAMMVSAAFGEPRRGLEATVVTITVKREADGKKYPVPVIESYELSKTGVLRYSAYFENMPIDLNHNDGIEWTAGADGKRVLAAAQAAIPSLSVWTDGTPQPGGGRDGYFVLVASKAGDTTRYTRDPKSKGWRRIDPVFRAMIAKFEAATGRPLRPEQLPQR